MSDKSAEPLGTREISPKVPREHWREIWHAKGSKFPAEENYEKFIIFLRASSTIKQSESESEKGSRRV
jgi:hypothetical protein